MFVQASLIPVSLVSSPILQLIHESHTEIDRRNYT